jgi:hypothetical protein
VEILRKEQTARMRANLGKQVRQLGANGSQIALKNIMLADERVHTGDIVPIIV